MSNEKFKVKFGLAVGDTVATIDGTSGDIVTSGDVAVNGGDLTTTAVTANLFNTNAATVNVGNAATSEVNLGNVSAGRVHVKSPSFEADGNAIFTGDVAVNGGDVTTTSGVGNLFNANATTVNIGNGASTEVNLGGTGAGRVQIKPDTIVGFNTTQNVFNTIATTVNAFGAATTVSIGANTGTTTINNDLVADSISVGGNIIATKGLWAKGIMDATFTDGIVADYATGNGRISVGTADTLTFYTGGVANTQTAQLSTTGDLTLVGDAAVNGGDVTTTAGTGNLFNTTATTVNVGNAATVEVNLGNTGAGRVQIKSPSIEGFNTTQAVFNTTATTVNAFGAATNVNMGAATGFLNVPGTILETTGKNILAGNTRVWGSGDAYDISRVKISNALGYMPTTGVLASNVDRVAATGARAGVTVRSYGQNVYAGTTTTTATPTISLESTRGTLAAPLAVGAGDSMGIINAWSNANTSGTTAYWTSDNYTVPPAQIAFGVVGNHTATAAAASNFTASFPATGGTTMTVTAVSSGTLAPRQEIRYVSGASAFSTANNFEIVGQLTSDQAAIASPTATGTIATNTIVVSSATGIVVGQLVTGTGIPTKTYVSAISSTTITLANFYGWPSFLTAAAVGGTYNFYTPGGTGTYEINVTPYTSITTGVVCTGTVVSFPTNLLLRTTPLSQPMTSTSRVNGVTVTSENVTFNAQPATYNSAAFTFATWPTTVPGGTGTNLLLLNPAVSSMNTDRLNLTAVLNAKNSLQWVAPTSTDSSNTVNFNTVSADGSGTGVFNFTNSRFSGANYSPTQSGDTLGSYKFNGQTGSGTSQTLTVNPAAQIVVNSTENYTASANGSKYNLNLTKIGTTSLMTVQSSAPEATTFQSDTFTVKTSGGTDYAAFTSPLTTITSDIVAERSVTPATFVLGTSSISGTVLTVGTLTSGTIASGAFLTGSGVTANTYIIGNIAGSGAGSTWIVSVSQTVSSTTITGSKQNLITSSTGLSYARTYGNFYDTTSQSLAGVNTETLMILGTTDIASGVSIVTNGTTQTRITIARAGTYNIQFSAQLAKTSGGASAVNSYIWLKKNDTNIPYTAGEIRIAGSGDRIMASWNYLVTSAIGDYYELAWSADAAGVQIVATAAAAPVPAIPSVILTVTPVGA